MKPSKQKKLAKSTKGGFIPLAVAVPLIAALAGPLVKWGIDKLRNKVDPNTPASGKGKKKGHKKHKIDF